MNRLTLLLSSMAILVLSATHTYAQDTTYREFATIPLPANTNILSAGSPAWTTDNLIPYTYLNQSQGNYFRGIPSLNGRTFLTTVPCNTLNNAKVWLSFAHICKLSYNNFVSGVVEISTNNGATWTRLTKTNSIYQGTSSVYHSTLLDSTFNDFSYTDWQVATPSATPVSSWWKQEKFDISTLAGNKASLQVRFRNDNTDAGAVTYGWLIDNVVITRDISERDAPIISLIAPQLTGQVFAAPPHTFFININDESSISSAKLFYTVVAPTLKTLDSVVLNRISRTGRNYRYQATINAPNITDGDSVQYYIVAIDSTPRLNVGRFPLATATPNTVNFRSSGSPTIDNYTIITGQQTNPTTHPITVVARDGSGISTVRVIYTLDGGTPQTLILTPSAQLNTFTGAIPTVDGNTVTYYVEIRDNSSRQNLTRRPQIGTHDFVASGPPIIVYPTSGTGLRPVLLGNIFGGGPYVVQVAISDASGINNAKVFYKINNGASLQIPMALTSGTTYEGTIPSTGINPNDSVSYYVEAIDNSPRANLTRNPLATATPNTRTFYARAATALPYIDDFETANVNWVPKTLSPPSSSGWQYGTPSKPILGGARRGTKAWATNLTANYPSSANWILESPVLSFTGITNAVISFWQKRRVSDANSSGTLGLDDGFYVEYTTDVNNTNPAWIRLGTPTDPNVEANWYNRSQLSNFGGAGWDGNALSWTNSKYKLAQLNNLPLVKFRFVLRSNTGASNDEGVIIDDINIFPAAAFDAGINAANLPIASATEIKGGTVASIALTVKNFGLQGLSGGIPGFYQINNSTPVPFTTSTTATVATGQTTTATVSFTAPDYNFTFNAWTSLNNDGISSNDTLSRILYGVPTFTVPYVDNFDAAPTKWRSTAATSRIAEWTQGTPTKTVLNNAKSTPNTWTTQLTTSYAANGQAWLTSGWIDMTNQVNKYLVFYQRRKLAAGSGFRIQYSTDANNLQWTSIAGLSAPNPNVTGWFNVGNTFLIGGSAQGNGWIGNTAGTNYFESRYPLSILNLNGPVRFRFEFGSGSLVDEGVSIDDFAIENPPAIDAGVSSILQPTSVPDLAATVPLSVTVRNYGGDTIRNVLINYSFNNGAERLPTPFSQNVLLAPNQSTNITLNSFPSTVVGVYTINVFTRLTSDSRQINDTAKVVVRGLPKNNAEITRLINPKPTVCGVAGTQQVTFEVRNTGHSPIFQIKAGYSVNNSRSVLQTFNTRIGRDTTLRFTFTQPLTVPVGPNEIRVYVDTVFQDASRINDTSKVQFNAIRRLNLNYKNNFNDCRTALNDFCLDIQQNAAGFCESNTLFNPNSFIVLTSGGNSNNFTPANNTSIWDSLNNQRYFANQIIAFNTTNQDSLRLRLDLRQYTSSTATNEVFFRVLCNGQPLSALVNNVLTSTFNNATTASIFRTLDFDMQGKYTKGGAVVIELQSKVRWQYFGVSTTNTRQANFIDNFEVYNKVTLSAGTVDISTNPPLPLPNQAVQVIATIRNSGLTTLDSVRINLKVNGNTLQTNKRIVRNLLNNDVFNVVFDSTFLSNTAQNEICVYTNAPNGGTDTFRPDDTLCITQRVLAVEPTPYCTGFEPNEPRWLTLNSKTYKQTGTSWQLGTPRKVFIDTTFAGLNAWSTDLAFNYPIRDSSALYSPIFNLDQSKCYRISFRHKYFIDPTGDGGSIEYSTDGGKNWYDIGLLNEPTWYNGRAIFALIDLPNLSGQGWTGKSPGNAWALAQRNFRLDRGAPTYPVIFRFRFSSDNSNLPPRSYEGWAIDNFCLEVNPLGCSFIGVNEVSGNDFVLGDAYPNPSNGSTTFAYALPKTGKLVLSVKDLVGKEVKTIDFGTQTSGKQQVELDLNSLDAGIYFYTLTFNGQSQTKKIVLVK